MKKYPLISIITATYNSDKTVEKSILSVLSQNYENIEYIIIDGGSTDHTIDIIKKYESKISYWISEKDNGIYDALNKGISIAKGDWCYILGSDDVLLTGVISKISEKFINSNNIYYGNVILSSTKKIFDGYFSRYKIMYKNISHQSIFYPRFIYKKYTYNLKYPSASDYEFLLRMIKKYWKNFQYLNLNICLYNNLDGVSSVSPDLIFFRDKKEIIRKNFPKYYYYIYVLRYYVVEFLKYVKLKKIIKNMVRK